MMKAIFSATLSLLALASGPVSGALVTLLDEEFTSGAAPTNTATAVWSTTDSNGFESYSNGGFGVRGISGGATPASPLGGLEVLNVDTDTTITIAINLPALLDDSVDGVFTFLAGQRIESSSGGFEGDLEIVNVTDGRTIRTQSAVNHPNFTMAANSVAIDFLASDAGDILELRFYERAGNSARGLELADLQLDVTTVPEPSTAITLIGLAGAGLWRRRRR